MLDGYFLLQGLSTYDHLKFYTHMTRGGQIFQKKSRSYLKVLGTRRVT